MSVVYPTKYKLEQKAGPFPKIIPAWSMKKGFRDEKPLQLAEVQPPSPYPINRRKPGVTLPVAGRLIPYNVVLTEDLPDLPKQAVQSLKEVSPQVKRGNGRKNKKGKKK